MEELNRSLFLLMNADLQSAPAAIGLATLFAEWLIYGIPLLLAGMWLWGRPDDRRVAFTTALSVAFALVCNQVISSGWPHPRPFMIHLGHVFLAHAPEASFPSDHVTVFLTSSMSFFYGGQRKAGAGIVLLGVLVGFSRVYLGVHFPFDIVGSCAVALGSSWFIGAALTHSKRGEHALQLLEALYRRTFAVPIVKGWVRS